ncbi:uncharacterized protein LOC107303897 [Oryza brachyantha]|uniref:uncharacterized protein LOC107303897 n=1 Tax=Oryza brachyantha TaxID=4533 RepID=UPI001AD9FB16|nr:uncharacterized protein LOC107303897 [Oryza brachyantha]
MIVLGFHDKFPHVTFSRGQIQDKEKELKRDYRCLKDARSQSGVSWDDKLGMIVADDPTLWSNICFSFPPAKKFRNKPFPIFEALGELYDGQTAEGLLSFTSLQPTNTQDQTTNPQDDVVTEIGADEFENQDDMTNDDPTTTSEHIEVEASTQFNERQSASTSRNRPLEDKRQKNPKRRKQNGNVAEMMEKYIELRHKQVEDEMAREKELAKQVDEYSIKNCIAVLSTMKELSPEETAHAFNVFKDTQNREIFMSVDPTSRIL